MNTNNRGQNEAIAFVLIFTVVLSLLGLVTIFGVPLLESAQADESITVMDRSFDRFHGTIERSYNSDNLTDIELQVPPGEFSPVVDETKITVSDGQQDVEIETQGFQFEPADEDGHILYDGGMVAERTADGSYNVITANEGAEVSELNSQYQLTIYSIEYVGEDFAIGDDRRPFTMAPGPVGDSTVTQFNSPGGDGIEVTVETEYPNAWEAHFERIEQIPAESIENTDETVVAEFDETYDVTVTDRPITMDDTAQVE